MKKIDLYTFIYNDEDFLPFFLEYYSFVDRITFIDSGSTDKSIEIIKKWAIPGYYPQVRLTQSGSIFWDWEKLHDIRNSIWQGNDYDIIFFPDCDEIFYKSDLKEFLDNNNFDVYEMEGFDMVANAPPVGQSILTVKTGVRHHMYNKSTIFNPRCEISFPNAHVRYCASANINMGSIYLLHYRYLGISLMKKRRDREKARLGKHIRDRKIMTDQEIIAFHKQLMDNAIKVI